VAPIGPVRRGLVVPDRPATEQDAPAVATHVSVDEPPAATLAGVAVKIVVICGGGTTVTVTVAEVGPPAPAQLSV
jgi:hypothetical protein